MESFIITKLMTFLITLYLRMSSKGKWLEHNVECDVDQTDVMNMIRALVSEEEVYRVSHHITTIFC